MDNWVCEDCLYYPPISCDGKPCAICNPFDPLLNCYQRKDKDDD